MDTYSSSDFTEAIVLQYTGHRLTHVDDSRKRAVFHFEKNYETDQIVRQLKEGRIRVEPRSFYIAQKEMKDRLYNK